MAILWAAGGALVLMLVVMWQRHSRCVDLIEAELRRFHFTGIRTSVAWRSFGLDSYTYDVRYVDTRGRRRRNRARVPIRAELDEVHWQHRVERPSSQRRTLDDEPARETGITLEGRLPLISDVQNRRITR